MSFSTPSPHPRRKRKFVEEPDHQESNSPIMSTIQNLTSPFASVFQKFFARTSAENSDGTPSAGDRAVAARSVASGKRQRLQSEDLDRSIAALPGGFNNDDSPEQPQRSASSRGKQQPRPFPLHRPSHHALPITSSFGRREEIMWDQLAQKFHTRLGQSGGRDWAHSPEDTIQRQQSRHKAVDLTETLSRGRNALRQGAYRYGPTRTTALRRTALTKQSASPKRDTANNGDLMKTLRDLIAELDDKVKDNHLSKDDRSRIENDAGIEDTMLPSDKIRRFQERQQERWELERTKRLEVLRALELEATKYFDENTATAQEQLAQLQVSPTSKQGPTTKKPLPTKEPQPAFIRLPPHSLLDRVTQKMQGVQAGDQTKVVDIGRIPISKGDLRKVLPIQGGSAWLNDNAISGWLVALTSQATELYNSRVPAASTTPRYQYLSTQFYDKMQSEGYKGVERWAKRAKVGGKNLLDCSKLFIPCNLNNTHWNLIVIFPTKKLVRSYDSMSGPEQGRQLKTARSFLEGELGDAYDHNAWRYEPGNSGSQQNSDDCGVFTCFNALALFYAESPKKLVPDGKMKDARYMLAAVLMNGGFKGELALDKYWPGLKLD